MDNSLASFRKKDIGRVGGENFNKWGNDEGDVDDDKEETFDVNVDTDGCKDVDDSQGDLNHVPELDVGPACVVTLKVMITGWCWWKSSSSVTPSPYMSPAHLQLLDIPTTIKNKKMLQSQSNYQSAVRKKKVAGTKWVTITQ